MEWEYLYSLLSFLVGFLAGFQAIYDRYKSDPVSALRTRYGVTYILIRGTLPALLFLFAYRARYFGDALPLWVWAVFCGTGLEAVARMTFYIREEKKDGGRVDLLKGPFDLLQWIQNWFLEEAATSLAAAQQKYVRDNLPAGVDFNALYERVSDNLPLFRHHPDLIKEIQNEIQKLKSNFDQAPRKGRAAAELDQRYREQLGYAILYIGGPRVFDVLMR